MAKHVIAELKKDKKLERAFRLYLISDDAEGILEFVMTDVKPHRAYNDWLWRGTDKNLQLPSKIQDAADKLFGALSTKWDNPRHEMIAIDPRWAPILAAAKKDRAQYIEKAYETFLLSEEYDDHLFREAYWKELEQAYDMKGADPKAMNQVVRAVSLNDMGAANRSITSLYKEIEKREAKKKAKRKVPLPKPSDMIKFLKKKVGRG
ncbi:MAG: hypothetical protein AAFU49_02800 [Pseudomonadota bacterium]